MITQETKVRATATNAFLITEMKKKVWAVYEHVRGKEWGIYGGDGPCCGNLFVKIRQIL
jgi:hypothetical protein